MNDNGDGTYSPAVDPSQGEGCPQVDASQASFYTYVNNNLTSIRDKIHNNNTALTQGEINFVNSVSMPVFRDLTVADLYEKAVGQDSSELLTELFIENASTPLAYELAINSIKRAIIYVRGMLMRVQGSKLYQNSEVIPFIQEFSRSLSDDLKSIEEDYKAEREIFRESWGKDIDRIKTMQQEINQKLAEHKFLASTVWARGLR